MSTSKILKETFTCTFQLHIFSIHNWIVVFIFCFNSWYIVRKISFYQLLQRYHPLLGLEVLRKPISLKNFWTCLSPEICRNFTSCILQFVNFFKVYRYLTRQGTSINHKYTIFHLLGTFDPNFWMRKTIHWEDKYQSLWFRNQQTMMFFYVREANFEFWNY